MKISSNSIISRIAIAGIFYAIFCVILYFSSWGKQVVYVVFIPIFPSIISTLLFNWIFQNRDELEKAGIETDPHKKLSYIKDTLDNIESYYLNDFEQDKSILESLFKIIDLVKEIKKEYKREEGIAFLALTSEGRAQRLITDIKRKYEKEFENEAQQIIGNPNADKGQLNIKNLAKLYCENGNLKLNDGDEAGALEAFNKAIQINPGYMEAFLMRGISKHSLGDYIGAIEDYNIVIQNHPNYKESYIQRGMSKEDLGDYNGAIEDYTEAIRIDPNDADAFIYRGDSKKELGDYKGAIEDYTEAIRIDPNYAKAYKQRGHSKYNLDDYKGAIEDYTEAIRIDSNDADAFFFRGNSKKELGDYNGSIEDYTEAIRIDPNNAAAYTLRGINKKELGDYNGAIEDFTNAIRVKLEYAFPYKMRAICLRELAETETNETRKAKFITKAEGDERKARALS